MCASMSDSSLKVRLRVALKIMFLAAALAIVYVFGSAFFSAEKRESSPDAMSVGVSQLQPGESLKVNWEGRPIIIYRRTPSEIAWLAQPQGGLADAASSRSVQPIWAQNNYRSKTPEWFVGLAVREDKACTIEVDKSRPEGGFISPCDGVIYDAAGRIFAGQTDASVGNLRVPAYDVDGDLVLLGARFR